MENGNVGNYLVASIGGVLQREPTLHSTFPIHYSEFENLEQNLQRRGPRHRGAERRGSFAFVVVVALALPLPLLVQHFRDTLVRLGR